MTRIIDLHDMMKEVKMVLNKGLDCRNGSILEQESFLRKTEDFFA